jgi:hypothetical protein
MVRLITISFRSLLFDSCTTKLFQLLTTYRVARTTGLSFQRLGRIQSLRLRSRQSVIRMRWYQDDQAESDRKHIEEEKEFMGH